MSRRRKKRRDGELDFELNIVSIIDALTILITFMLAAGSYISIGVLQVGVSANAAATPMDPSKLPPVELKLELKENYQIALKISGKENNVISIPAVRGKWDFDMMKNYLSKWKQKWPTVKVVTLIAHPTVLYQDVVRVMELTRKTHKDVLLGGF